MIDTDNGDICQHHSPHGPVYFTHKALDHETGHLRHGFFTASGGVSSGVYESLNCGFGSDDSSEHITENRRRVCKTLSLQENRLAGLYQTHSSKCLILDNFPSPYYSDINARPSADGLVTRLSNIGLAILTADCLPILFADKTKGIIGACHAGWRGAVSGIIENTIAAMLTCGAHVPHIQMVIGPAIQQKHYQIDHDMADNIKNNHPDCTDCFCDDSENAQKTLFDLPKFAIIKAQAIGLCHIFAMPLDSYSNPNLFFSYRRATHQGKSSTGRLISVITQGA